MTKDEWLASNDPAAMLQFIRHKAHSSVLVSVSIAICRTDDSLMGHQISRDAIEWIESVLAGESGLDDSSGPSDGDCYLMATKANRCLAIAAAQHDGNLESLQQNIDDMIEILSDEVAPEQLAKTAEACRRVVPDPFRDTEG